jgi:hypothetical protein
MIGDLTNEEISWVRWLLRQAAQSLTDSELDLLCRIITLRAINTGGAEEQQFVVLP